MTRDEPLWRSLIRDTTGYLAYLLLITTLGPFQFGFHLVLSLSTRFDCKLIFPQAELNAPQDVLTCKEKKSVHDSSLSSFLPQCIPMNITQFSVVTSVFTLGGLIGALAAGPSCNSYGRLLTMRSTTFSFVFGAVLECLAPNIGVLCVGRLVSGLGCGAAIVVVPIYISEVAPPKEKGLFGAFTQVMINLGILVSQLLGYFLSKGNSWRIILAVAGGIGLVTLAGLLLVPESPKWLAEHRSPENARHILRRIRGHKADVDVEVKAWNIDASAEDICTRHMAMYKPLLTHTQPKKRPF